MPIAEPYAREPIRWDDDIPVFSEASPYIENYERIADDHLAEEARTGHNPFIPESLWQESEGSTVELIERYTKPGDRVLDVGVGLGRLLDQFPDRDRYGFDISLPYLRRAKAKGINVALSLIEDMPYRPETFDAVLATDVLEHVLDLNDAITRILAVLKPGGVLVIRTPNREDLSNYLTPTYPYFYVHLRSFDEPGIRLLMSRVFGCHVVETRLAGYALYAPYCRLPVPNLMARAFSRLIARPLATRLPAVGLPLQRRLYRPVEINVIVSKPLA